MYEAFYRWIRQVPSGKVATYGQIARLAGMPRHSRHVGYALAALPTESDVPWFRIINGEGRISKRDPWEQKEQLRCLEAEGVAFLSGRVDLRRYGWTRGSAFQDERPESDA
jgi:methylated-DNA-protein-cysteine methyltransferase-like protein